MIGMSGGKDGEEGNMRIGVQTKNVVYDSCPEKGFRMLKEAGFSCADFSLNSYLTNAQEYGGLRLFWLSLHCDSWV